MAVIWSEPPAGVAVEGATAATAGLLAVVGEILLGVATMVAAAVVVMPVGVDEPVPGPPP
jgi:hypothetical protein